MESRQVAGFEPIKPWSSDCRSTFNSKARAQTVRARRSGTLGQLPVGARNDQLRSQILDTPHNKEYAHPIGIPRCRDE